MLVRKQNFDEIIAKFLPTGQYGCDTETTSLRPYQGGRLFSIILSSEEESCYFNFLHYDDAKDDWVLGPEHLEKLKPIFFNPDSLWFMHNAKFDMAMLENEGIEVKGKVHCTMAIARLVDNSLLAYGLDALVKPLGHKKDDAAKAYILEHNLWEWESIPGKKQRSKNLFYYKVPLRIIGPYGCKDGSVTRELGLHQIKKLDDMQHGAMESKKPLIHKLYENEMALTKVCHNMEQEGILIDRPYCERAIVHEQAQYFSAMDDFKDKTGFDFVDSGKALAKVFTAMGEEYPKTKKGNPSFTDEVLEKYTTPVAKLVQNYRASYKKCNSYFRNFTYYADENDIVHANIRQSGCTTGRMSASNPALQTLNKEEDKKEKFLVRKSFIPPKGFCFLMLDYDQMEYKMMLDYAGEMSVIHAILNDGLDVHEATGKLVGISRTKAKTINFGLLYGQGAALLAKSLGITIADAKSLKYKYFRNLPRVEKFIRACQDVAKSRGFIYNWAGRVSKIEYDFAYKAPNYLIQGGTADVIKIAMVKIHKLLEGRETKLLLQIHDELLFKLHETELDLAPALMQIMEEVYPHKHLPLTCSAEHSWVSWADKEKGFPSAVRNQAKDKSYEEVSSPTKRVASENSAGLS